jgi:hypothetical protein
MFDEMLSGAALDPYRVPALTTCWWCGRPGPLTREHKFKRSDLGRMWDGDESLLWGNGTERRTLKSMRKSRDVRFEPGLCGPCNNDRSQPFDRAYQAFSDYVWNHGELGRADWLDMAQVYGATWPTSVPDLARYFGKHIGCRMAHDRFPIPPSLSAFLDGTAHAADVQMVLFKSQPHYDVYRQAQAAGDDARGLWLEPGLGHVSPSRGRLVTYSGSLIVNFVGVFYRWELEPDGLDPFYDYRRARLHWRHKLPDY